jgi:hypothetical protein
VAAAIGSVVRDHAITVAFESEADPARKRQTA